ncbi:DUF2232 domain-containing protein [Salinicoccus cyprini]|uniref:DUF2232 domain-containing protein n=1 Tax=Salinicoccus cyprini TaxID=2493691 RepID=A0A558AUV5_9STAP|nr:DUF2232 domain-containing protein [Salinicoccus cyprini]TVT28052.1 DUF2232 domain-containing protein [Salinicoccus cyprini]
MNKRVSMLQLMLVLFAVFVFITLTDISLLFGAVLLPFAVYFLVNLKHQSNYHFWLTFVSFLIPAALLLSPDAWVWFVVLYIVATVVHHTLKKNISQELALFYVTATLMLSFIGILNLLQGFGIIQPISDAYLDIRSWYLSQLEMYGTFAADLDTDIIRTSMDQIFINLPAYITVIAFLLALYTILMQRVLFSSSSVKMWNYCSFKDWAFPRLILYLFLILFVVSFFTTEGTTAQSTVSNLLIVVEWMLYLHGLSFSYFFFREKKLNVALSILLLIPLVILRPITLLIGLFEMIFRIRTLIQLKRK